MFPYRINDDIRLTLPIPEIDASPLFRLIDESRDELFPWLPWVLNIKNCEDERLSLIRNQSNITNLRSLNLIIWYQDSIAGSISLKNLDSNTQTIEIGYWLGTRFTGKGIMTRTVKGLCTLVFTKYKIHKINIYIASDNLASNQVANRAGFYLEAKLRDNALLFNQYHDENLWTLLENEWRNY